VKKAAETTTRADTAGDGRNIIAVNYGSSEFLFSVVLEKGLYFVL
jgi:hypothetical protein